MLAIPSGQQRALLALLVLNANSVLSADRIVDAVWGDEAPGSGTKVLAFHVSRLRDALAPGRQPGEPAGGLETVAGGYVLRVDPDAIDAVRFERLVREGHARLADEPAAARDLLLDALGMWRGSGETQGNPLGNMKTPDHKPYSRFMVVCVPVIRGKPAGGFTILNVIDTTTGTPSPTSP